MAVTSTPSTPSPAREGETWPALPGTQETPQQPIRRDILRETQEWLNSVGQEGVSDATRAQGATQLLLAWINNQTQDPIARAIADLRTQMTTQFGGMNTQMNTQFEALRIQPPSIPSTGWASIASNGLSNSSFATTTGSRNTTKTTSTAASITTRAIANQAGKLREIRVHISDGEERERAMSAPNRVILSKINSYFTTGAKMAGIRRLPSRDIILQAIGREAKETLVRDTKWLSVVIGKSATIIPERFSVFVHSVKVTNVETTDQEKALKKAQEDNETIHPGVKILRVAWPKKALGRTYSSMIVEVASPEEANRMIELGYVEGGEVKSCELFEAGCKLTQCFKCSAFGHVARACRNKTRCGFCAGGHNTQTCNKKEAPGAKPKCANCTQGHEAWASNCSIRKKEIHRTTQVFAARPRLYNTGPPLPPLSFSIGTATTFRARATAETILTQGLPATQAPRPKIGRPPGSLNKKHVSSVIETSSSKRPATPTDSRPKKKIVQFFQPLASQETAMEGADGSSWTDDVEMFLTDIDTALQANSQEAPL
jgi:hypothetical protein